jgi:hypothetical protein
MQKVVGSSPIIADARRGAPRRLAAVDDLRALARAANPGLIRLGLTECKLHSWGVPL